MKENFLVATFSFVLVAISFFIFANAIDLTVKLSEAQRLIFSVAVVSAYITCVFATIFYYFRFPYPRLEFEYLAKRFEVLEEPKPSMELLSEVAVYEIKKLEIEHEEELERNQELLSQLKTLTNSLSALREEVSEGKISEIIAQYTIAGVLSYVEDIKKQLKSLEKKEKVRARIPMKDLVTQIIKKLLK